MICRFEDIQNKEVVNIKSGRKLGYPDDIEIETCTAKICKLIICGRARCFGLFGRDPDIVIPWCDVEVIGVDTILVCGECGEGKEFRPKLFGRI